MGQTRVVLDESGIPAHWHNIAADLNDPAEAIQASLAHLPKVG